MTNIHKALKTRTSWSSIETSDSSGIGSYNSLNSQHRSTYSSNSVIPTHYNSRNESDAIEPDFLSSYDVSDTYPLQPPAGFHQGYYVNDQTDMKYATIDRSHFSRNQLHTPSLRESNLAKQRSNSLGENNGETFPDFPDYKMNLPKTKMHTVGHTRGHLLPTCVRQTIFQVFDGQDPAELLKRLSPPTTPQKKPIPPPQRPNYSTAGPQTLPKPNRTIYQKQLPDQSWIRAPRQYTVDNEPEAAKPGSFEAALQQRRLVMKKRSLSVDHSSLHYR